MIKLKYFAFRLFIKFRRQSVLAFQTADFYGNLLTERQKLNIIVAFMVMLAAVGANILVELIGFIYIMYRLTPEQ